MGAGWCPWIQRTTWAQDRDFGRGKDGGTNRQGVQSKPRFVTWLCVSSTSLQGFGSETYGLVRHIPSPASSYIDHYCVSDSKQGLAKILTESDYICSVLPKTDNTTDLLGNEILEICKGLLKRLLVWNESNNLFFSQKKHPCSLMLDGPTSSTNVTCSKLWNRVG